MPKIFTSEKQKIGEIGENIATKFLMKQGFIIKERNYTKKWGEIDIIAEKNAKIYFIEVKSVTKDDLSKVTQETKDGYKAEDNMHPWKLKRLYRTIQTYLISKKIDENTNWQLDLIIVYLDLKNKKAKLKTVSNIIL